MEKLFEVVFPLEARDRRICDKENWLIATVFDNRNAEYIVRCVNSHEALVKALQDLTQAVANLDSPEGGLGGLGYLNESAERAEAVLAAAGEQP